MSSKTTIAVLGGSGRTGTFLIKALVDHGYKLKLLVREPSKIFFRSDDIEVFKGDALDLQAIKLLLKDCRAVMSTIGQRKDEPLVASQVTKHILEGMELHNVYRYLSLAGLNIDVPSDNKSQQTLMAAKWMKDNFPTIHEDRQHSYSILEQNTSIRWTVVRVPYIEFQEASGNIKVNLEDCPGTKVTAGDIAQFMVRELTDERFIHQAPFIASS
jgi:putative NADH-flavin reductase